MTNRFKKARENKDFINNDLNSDVSNDKQFKDCDQIITRNKIIINIEKNKLAQSKRIRTKHGRNLTTPLFVEELNVIDETVNKIGQVQNISINIFVREIILQHCKKVLGNDKYQEIIDKQYNVVKGSK